jgi:hypothetical protein
MSFQRDEFVPKIRTWRLISREKYHKTDPLIDRDPAFAGNQRLKAGNAPSNILS